MTGDRLVYRSSRTGQFISKRSAKRSKYVYTELHREKKVYRVKGYRDKIVVRKAKRKPVKTVKRVLRSEPPYEHPERPSIRIPVVEEEEEEPDDEEIEEWEQEWQEEYESDWSGLDYLDYILDYPDDEDWYEET